MRVSTIQWNERATLRDKNFALLRFMWQGADVAKCERQFDWWEVEWPSEFRSKWANDMRDGF